MRGKSILVSAFILLILGTSIATGFYQVIDPGGSYIYPMGLNEHNQVVGHVKPNGSWSNAYAFYWSAETGIKSLGGYRANEINDFGQIAGNSGTQSRCQAAVWENGSWVILEGRQEASAINNNGQVTGLISAQPYIPGPYAPFRDDDIHSPGFIELKRPYSRASHGFDINNKGQIVADCGSTMPKKKYVAVFYNQYGSYTILDDNGNYDAHARGINDLGQIVGNSMITNGSDHLAVFWNSPNSGMEYMGSLGDGSSVAYAINNLGQAVGFSAGKAFIWSHEGGMVDLNSFINPGLGITLTMATDINDKGVITVWGVNSLGQECSFLIIPEPATLFLLVIGGLFLKRRRI